MKLERLDHVAIAVRDVPAAAQWYKEVLGFEEMHAGVWGDIPLFVGAGGSGLALFPVEGAGRPRPGNDTLTTLHIAFRADRLNFEAAREELQKRRITFAFEDHQIAHSIYFRDPDGHRLEITTYEV